jgi:hypothetical protein
MANQPCNASNHICNDINKVYNAIKHALFNLYEVLIDKYQA